MVLDNIESLALFSYVWYVCIVVGCKMIVWQGSYYVKCVWQKSHNSTTEGCVAVQISKVVFGLSMAREVVEDGFLDLYFEWKYMRICCAMYIGTQNFYLIIGFVG